MASPIQLDRFYQAALKKGNFSNRSKRFHLDYLKHFWLRRLGENVFVFLFIFSFEFYFLDPVSVPIIALDAGFGLSALFLRGRYVLVGIFLAKFLSTFLITTNVTSALYTCAFFTFYLGFIRECCLKLIGAVAPLYTLRCFFQFTLICAIGAGFYALKTHSFLISINLLFTWLNQLNGLLYLTPLSLLLDPFSLPHYFQRTSFERFLPQWLQASLFLQALLIFVLFYSSIVGILVISFLLLLYGMKFPPLPVSITLLIQAMIILGMSSFSGHKLLITMALMVGQVIGGLSLSIWLGGKRVKPQAC